MMITEGDILPAYQNKTKLSWFVSFYVRKEPNKPKVKIKKEGFKTKRDALEYENNYISQYSKPKHSILETNFATLTELYLQTIKPRIRETTFENKKYIIKTKILPYFSNFTFADINTQHILIWQNNLLNSHYKYSQTYLKTINNQLSAIFNYAVKVHHLPINPIQITGSIGKKNANQLNFWTVDEFHSFIIFFNTNNMYKLAFNILFWTGIRIGELLALTLADFDFDKATLFINKNYARHQKKDLILEPKTPKSKRTITLHPNLIKQVKDYVNCLYEYKPKDRLFTISKHSMYKAFKLGYTKAGIKKIRIHDLRHSHASLLIELGFSPLLIAERLGHENIQTTLNIYAHLYPSKQQEVSKKIQEISN